MAWAEPGAAVVRGEKWFVAEPPAAGLEFVAGQGIVVVTVHSADQVETEFVRPYQSVAVLVEPIEFRGRVRLGGRALIA